MVVRSPTELKVIEALNLDPNISTGDIIKKSFEYDVLMGLPQGTTQNIIPAERRTTEFQELLRGETTFESDRERIARTLQLSPEEAAALTPKDIAIIDLKRASPGTLPTEVQIQAELTRRGFIEEPTPTIEPTPEPTPTAPILKIGERGERSIYDPVKKVEYSEGTADYQKMLLEGNLRAESPEAYELAIRAREEGDPSLEDVIISRSIEAAGYDPITGEPLPLPPGPISQEAIEKILQERRKYQEFLLEEGVLEEKAPSFLEWHEQIAKKPQPVLVEDRLITPLRTEVTPREEFERFMPMMPDEPLIDIKLDLLGKRTITFSEEMGLLPFMKGTEKLEDILGGTVALYKGEEKGTLRYKSGEFLAGFGKWGFMEPVKAAPPLVYAHEQIAKRELKALFGDEKAITEIGRGVEKLPETMGITLFGKEEKVYVTKEGAKITEPEIPGIFPSMKKAAVERPEYFVGGALGTLALLGVGKGVQKVKTQKAKVDVTVRALEEARAEAPFELIPTGKKTLLETELSFLTAERKIEFGMQLEPHKLTRAEAIRAIEQRRTDILIGEPTKIHITPGERSIHTHPIDSPQLLKKQYPWATKTQIKNIIKKQEFFSKGDINSFISTSEREAVLITSTGKKVVLKEGKHFTTEKWDAFLTKWNNAEHGAFYKLSLNQRKKLLREAGLSVKTTKIKTTPEAEFKILTRGKVTRIEKAQTFLGLEKGIELGGGPELGGETILGAVPKSITEAVELSKAMRESQRFTLPEKVEVAPIGEPRKTVGKTIREDVGLFSDIVGEPIIDYTAYDPFPGIEARLTIMGKERAATKLRRAKLAKAGPEGEVIEIETLFGAPEGLLTRRTKPAVGPEGKAYLIFEETPPIPYPEMVGGYFEIGEAGEPFGFGLGALKPKPKPTKEAQIQTGPLQRRIISEEPIIMRIPKTEKVKPIAIQPTISYAEDVMFQEPLITEIQKPKAKEKPKPLLSTILGLTQRQEPRELPLLIELQRQRQQEEAKEILIAMPKVKPKEEPSIIGIGEIGRPVIPGAVPPRPKKPKPTKKAKKKPTKKPRVKTEYTPSLLGLTLGVEEKGISLKSITGIGIRGVRK